MPKVSRLVQGKKDPTRVNIYLDGKFSFSLSAIEVMSHGLKVGDDLEEDGLKELKNLSSNEKIFAKIINFISYRPRSEKEVRDRLYKYLGTGQEEVKNELISKLKKLDYLDDHKFATWFVESRRTNRPRSIRHLSSELFSKGISKDIIESVLKEGADDREAIRKVIDKKKGMDHDKLVAYLARRGFSWEIIRSELDKMPPKG